MVNTSISCKFKTVSGQTVRNRLRKDGYKRTKSIVMIACWASTIGEMIAMLTSVNFNKIVSGQGVLFRRWGFCHRFGVGVLSWFMKPLSMMSFTTSRH